MFLGTLMTKPNTGEKDGRREERVGGEGERINVVGDSIYQQARSGWDNGLDIVELQTISMCRRVPTVCYKYAKL